MNLISQDLIRALIKMQIPPRFSCSYNFANINIPIIKIKHRDMEITDEGYNNVVIIESTSLRGPLCRPSRF